MWKRLFDWIRKTFEHKGEPSSKRATLFVLVIMYLGLNVFYCIHVTEVEWKFYQLVLNAVIILLILGVATFENIIQFIQSIKGGLLKKEKDGKDTNDNSNG